MNDNRLITPHEQLLLDALIKRGIHAIPHYPDGHKTVDIGIPEARLFIEVDDMRHFTNSEQIKSDFKRAHYSDGDDFATFYVTNQILDRYLQEVADALKTVIDDRIANFT